MNKKTTSIVSLVIIAGIAFFFGGMDMVYEVLGIDVKAPVIEVDHLPSEVEYLFDFDSIDFTCEDNMDETCEVAIEGALITGDLGEYSVILTAEDNEGNKAEVIYTYDVVDTTAPIIYTDDLRSLVQVDSSIMITCSDNYDTTCSIIANGLDTTTLGPKSVVLISTDSSGNQTTYTYNYEVIEGLDTTMYVPHGYYDGIDGLTGTALQNALNAIITDHDVYPYTSTATDVWDILRDADEDPENSDNVIMFYTRTRKP